MIHARSDYDRIQDPAVEDPSLLSPGSTPIGEDEPVFLIRGRDQFAPGVVRVWGGCLEKFGGDPEVVRLVYKWAERIEEWQAAHGYKIPDVPAECMKR